MSFENLFLHCNELINYMKTNKFSRGYVSEVQTEIRWLTENSNSVESYEEACSIRESETELYERNHHYRTIYGLLKNFDVNGMYPNHKRNSPIFKAGCYFKLCPEYKEIVDMSVDAARCRGVAESTNVTYSSNISSFLYAMQNSGKMCLSEISEDDVLAFCIDPTGNPIHLNCIKTVSAILNSDLGSYSSESRRIASYFPNKTRHRKNIQYLQPEELESIHAVLEAEDSGLCKRDKAICILMYFTGIRACDIVKLTFQSIDWNEEKIVLCQSKTGVELQLPLTPMIGNSIYDYIEKERPETDDEHVFVSKRYPYESLKSCAIGTVSSRLYDLAGVRLNKGDRRGNHLFRYNVATYFIGKGVPRPVVSATLGHSDPASLDYYFFADIPHLRECALSIDKYPVRKGVFDL